MIVKSALMGYFGARLVAASRMTIVMLAILFIASAFTSRSGRDLRVKQCRILELLRENFDELVLRESLMQKVWFDDGVITGRSLDMFVSKLRRKLSSDSSL